MDETQSILKQSLVVTLAAIIAIATVFGLYYWFDRKGSETAPPPAAVAEPAPPPATAPAPAAPPVVAERDADRTTPLDGSDAKVLEALSGIGGWSTGALRLLLTKDLIRHLVATIDALARDKLPTQALPLRSVPGAFQVTVQGTRSTIAPGNARRYEAYVKAAGALDMRGLAAVYRHFYPQFQQAYHELGYPKGEFNDRLLEVIDELLEAPEPKPPLEVAAPGVMYHYVDADLEALSAGQKILVRVGPGNEETLKGLLRQLRQALTR